MDCKSILLLVCCAGIFAIPAIIYAAQVNGKLQSGDYAGAMQASENAKKWCIIGLIIGLVCNTLAIGGQILLVGLSDSGQF